MTLVFVAVAFAVTLNAQGTGTAINLGGNQVTGTLPQAKGGTGNTTGSAAKIGGVAVTGTPSAGQVPTATSGSAATWQTPGNAATATAFAAAPTKCSAGNYNLGIDVSGNAQNCTAVPLAYLSGTTGSIGGGLLAAGACATGNVTVTGATTGMAAIASPAGGVDPSNGGILGVAIDARVSATNTVQVSVCSPVAGTPAAANYNVRVIQ